MRNSLAVKLILAFLAVALTAAVLVAVLVRRSNADELYRVILQQQTSRLQNELIDYYQTNHSWDGVAKYLNRNNPALPQQPGPPPAPNNPNNLDAPLPPNQTPNNRRFGVTDTQGRTFVPWADVRIGDVIPKERLREGVPLVVDGATVGYFFAVNINVFDSPQASAYLDHTDQALIPATIGAVMLALVLGALLTRSLLRPIRELTCATHALTQGKRGEQIIVRSDDELGKLTIAFNQMSSDLMRAENARRQMTADVAHDLRTPLTVLSAYIESLREGVLKPTPQRLDVMQTEVDHLSHLVEDLMTLAKADAGEITLKRQPIALADLLDRIAQAYELQAHNKHIALTHQADPDLPKLNIDEKRMTQVLGNLVSNAIRHTSSGGQVALTASRADDCITLVVSDTGEGIAASALPFVFDRFFRADKSRFATGDESGLGLAIVKSLVEAHGGSIAVESQIGVGTTFTLTFKTTPRIHPI